MTAQLNHTIVWCRDNRASAEFFAEILGLRPPRPYFNFEVIELGNGVSLDFMAKDGPVAPQHYAFLVGEDEFDSGLLRIKEHGLGYWADPARTEPGQINHHFGGRGVYFDDPNGHLLELITKPYGAEEDL